MLTLKLKKSEGKLSLEPKSKIFYDEFIKNLKEGDEVEMFINVVTSHCSLAQLSRELAKESGYTFEEMKLLVKQRSGLCLIVSENGVGTEICKSFSECTKDEMMMAIQACIEIGQLYNINLA
jgi:hypothetical protein